MSTPPPASNDWDDAYRRDAPPPWDIGRPQPAFLALTDEGLVRGSVFDAGCGASGALKPVTRTWLRESVPSQRSDTSPSPAL